MLFFFSRDADPAPRSPRGMCLPPSPVLEQSEEARPRLLPPPAWATPGLQPHPAPQPPPQHPPAPLRGETEAQELGAEARAQAWLRQSHATGVRPPLRGPKGPPAPHRPTTQLSRVPSTGFFPSSSSATEQLLRQDDEIYLSVTQAPRS